jgi:hypothetical protein
LDLELDRRIKADEIPDGIQLPVEIVLATTARHEQAAIVGMDDDALIRIETREPVVSDQRVAWFHLADVHFYSPFASNKSAPVFGPNRRTSSDFVSAMRWPGGIHIVSVRPPRFFSQTAQR